MTYKIPLSYTEINHDELNNTLIRFREKDHEEIIQVFEKDVCEITGSPFAIAVNSGTSAIHLALCTLGVTSGDLVAVSTFTYIGSVNPIRYLDARPVFIDSEPFTWNMDPGLLEKCLNDLDRKGQLPKAIIVVHSYGMPAMMNELLAVAQKYEVPIIEDAAAALGATYFGQQAGSMGKAGIISFNNNKTITAFGGGVLLTADASIANSTRQLASHAREQKPYYEYRKLGYNYRMSALNAACGISSLKNWSERISRRMSVFEYYKQHLNEACDFVSAPERVNSSRWLTAFTFRKLIDPLKVQAELVAKSVETRPLWNPMHLQPCFRNERGYFNGVSERLFRSGLCVPSGGYLSKNDLDTVIRELYPLIGYS